MVPFLGFLVVLHVAANLVWVGAIAAVGVIVQVPHGTPVDRGRIALAVYRWLATPAFLTSLTLGLLRLLQSLDFYFVQSKFMHGKLMFAVFVIALHHVLGATAKRMASGQLEGARHAGKLVVSLLICAVVTTFFAVAKPF